MNKYPEKELKNYLNLPFTTILRRDEEGDVIAEIKELDGCVAHGEDEMDALNALESMKTLWITSALKRKEPIPMPESREPLPSGKWLQRVPRSLHKKLSEMSKSEGVSLNQLVTSLLSEAVGTKKREEAVPGVIPKLEAFYWVSDATKNIMTFRHPERQNDKPGSQSTESSVIEVLSQSIPTRFFQPFAANQEMTSRASRESKTEKHYSYQA